MTCADLFLHDPANQLSRLSFERRRKPGHEIFPHVRGIHSKPLFYPLIGRHAGLYTMFAPQPSDCGFDPGLIDPHRFMERAVVIKDQNRFHRFPFHIDFPYLYRFPALTFVSCSHISLLRLTISIAPSAQSYPLFPALLPALAMAWSMFSVVTTPNIVGTPVERATCAVPLETSLQT